MKKILLLTARNGREIAVFVDKIAYIFPDNDGLGTTLGLSSGEEAHVCVKESFDDILFSLHAANIALAFRIRSAKKAGEEMGGE